MTEQLRKLITLSTAHKLRERRAQDKAQSATGNSSLNISPSMVGAGVARLLLRELDPGPIFFSTGWTNVMDRVNAVDAEGKPKPTPEDEQRLGAALNKIFDQEGNK